MKFILKKFINYSIFFGLIFVINSCAHFRIIHLEKNNFETENFYQLLSKEYLELAKYELYEMHDEIDANLFAYKSSLSLNKNIFYPEDPKNWKIPSNYQKTAFILLDKINKFIDQKIYLKYPESFSKTLAAYDCWIEQVEENWQTEHINACYEKFNQNYNSIAKKISNAEQTLEHESSNKTEKSDIKEDNKTSSTSINKNPEKNIKTTLTEITQIYETKVFFEFDKFTLSSEQIIELEFFVKTAIQNSSMEILIEGHTDTMGPQTYNNSLSKKRANFIKKYLVNRNLRNIITTKAYGESKPLIATDDEVKEKKNRRAELYLK